VKHARELEQVGPGARVRFELSVNHERTVITSLRKTSAASPGFQLPATHPLPRGERVPDFALISEQGRPVRLSEFRGKVVALDFIYTRCPLPDVCPRLSANFRRLQRRFGPSLTLLSVTIDPVHDTPERLSQYAKLWTANPDSWHFLTGDPREIQKVASNFGMIYFPDDESITHTSNTAVIARDGTLAGIVEGSSYAVSQLGDLIALELEAH
jgi:protein SCO1/2